MKHDNFVIGAVFIKEEDQILSWSFDGSIKLWDTHTGQLKVAAMKHGRSVKSAIFNQQETQILSWSSGGSIKL